MRILTFKNRKSCFLILGLVLLFPSQSFGYGGATGVGDGGNILEEDKVHVDGIRSVAETMRQPLLAYFNWRSILHARRKYYNEATVEFDRILFDGPVDVFKKFDELEDSWGMRYHSACPSQDGKHEDGSYDPSGKPKICISIKTLSEKLNTSNVKAQVFGLMLHEIGHAMGMNEAQAQELQKVGIKSFRGSVHSWNDMDYVVDHLAGDLFSIYPGDGTQLEGMCDSTEGFLKYLGSSSQKIHHLGKSFFSGYNISNLELYHEMTVRLANLNQYSCIHDQRVSFDVRMAHGKTYKELFGDRDSIQISDFWEKLSLEGKLNIENVLELRKSNVTVPKLDGPARVRMEWQRYFDIVDKLSDAGTHFHGYQGGNFSILDRK